MRATLLSSRCFPPTGLLFVGTYFFVFSVVELSGDSSDACPDPVSSVYYVFYLSGVVSAS